MRFTLRTSLFRMVPVALIAGGLALAGIDKPASGSLPLLAEPAVPGLSLLTYNVEGLPWPVRFGRAEDLSRIAGRLRTLRQLHRQPHIIALQEAFTADAQQIGGSAGYRYIATGPSAGDAAPQVASSRADAPPPRQFWKGEASGKLLGSGLLIASDYPILAVKREPFPATACAGYDCLANKGIVMAVVKTPDSATPLAIIDTHLNSRYASHVPFEQSLAAFEKQVDALDSFMARNVPAHIPVIVAGDFNIGRDPDRIAYFNTRIGHWLNPAAPDAYHACLALPQCTKSLTHDAYYSYRRGRDWQFLIPAPHDQLSIRQISIPFGQEPGGGMLSDHVGYIAHYDFRSGSSA